MSTPSARRAFGVAQIRPRDMSTPSAGRAFGVAQIRLGRTEWPSCFPHFQWPYGGAGQRGCSRTHVPSWEVSKDTCPPWWPSKSHCTGTVLIITGPSGTRTSSPTPHRRSCIYVTRGCSATVTVHDSGCGMCGATHPPFLTLTRSRSHRKWPSRLRGWWPSTSHFVDS